MRQTRRSRKNRRYKWIEKGTPADVRRVSFVFLGVSRLISGPRKKNVCFSVIDRIIYLNKMHAVNFNEAYILIKVLIVYLDGNAGIYMILKMMIASKLLTV
ncbi:hypothetical protein SAMN04487897_12732 [Paenibacillus sp. yr247]|nr:hypothetical protein SAMN04487897_12732 [Paenibacillus sp. yr247]